MSRRLQKAYLGCSFSISLFNRTDIADTSNTAYEHSSFIKMASTDSTIPDTVTGDSTGAQGGQSFSDKAKSVFTGNVPTVSDVKPQDSASKPDSEVDGAGKESGSGLEQNTLV